MNKMASYGVLVMMLFFEFSCWSARAMAQDEITGGDVGAVIGNEYALTPDGVAAYRKCVNAIPLGSLSMHDYQTKVAECKEQAKRNAYQIPNRSIDFDKLAAPVIPGGPNSAVGAAADRAWQNEKLIRIR